MKKAAIATFGCKLNQYETQLMIEQLKEEYEFGKFNDVCDLYIINSCAVTAKAAKESRQTLKKAKKTNPLATIIYTGCDSYLENNLPATIVGNSYKNNIKKALQLNYNDTKDNTKTYPIDNTLSNYMEKSRAFIKIQEGCNNRCTYCIIPQLRGRERDKSQNFIIKEILLLQNFPEIVLTGTNIGSYKNLKKLLKNIEKLNLSTRIRISSIEPMYIDSEFIDIIAYGNFANHLHIPLQSGSDKILKLMGRNYSKNQFERIVNECNKKGIFVGTDVIVGFFQENEERFKETYNFINSLPLTYGHVFSYSKRPLTPAENIQEQLEKGPIIKQRNAILTKLFQKKLQESVKNMVGRKTSIVIEPTRINKSGKLFYRSIASEYFNVLVKEYKGGLVETTIQYFDGEYAYA